MVVIKKKDVLEELLATTDFEFINILPDGRRDNKLSVALGQLKQDYRLLKIARKFRPDVLAGTSVAISHVGRILGIPSINLNEDDAEIVPLYARLAYPWASAIIAPYVCSVGKWESKKIGYPGYHELAYLHPNHFTPSAEVASRYLNVNERYFVIRFAKLTAHHDDGVKGISNAIAKNVIKLLAPHGKVYITSERKLEAGLEEYRMNINPIDIHHVMAFASMYIGDSQTMAAEAGVLGVPFIRFNDFVGRIGYLKELEERYQLGYGILPGDEPRLYRTITQVLELQDARSLFQQRRDLMLSESIDLTAFLTWLIRNYPESVSSVKREDFNLETKFR